jgi:DNA polymerase-3 subunit epsilon
MPRDAEGRTVFSLLRAAARRPTTRLLAASTPFDAKDLLKARGYRWEAGQGGRPKGWFRDLTDDVTEEETGWLAEAVYTGRPDVHRYALDAWSRYSEREWA